jgi:zona occludens toxin
MAMLIFTGTLGSGKSYHALCLGLEKVRAKRENIVVANFPIVAKNDKEKKRWFYQENLTVDFLIKKSFSEGIYGKEGRGLVIIDEAPLMFNSRDSFMQSKERREWIKFFSLSRRFGYDIILISQDLRMIDRQIRTMAEYEVKHVCANRYGWLSWIPIKTFFYVWFWSGGKFKGGLQVGFLLPWVARRYDTMKQFSPSPELIELAYKHGYNIKPEAGEPDPGGEGGAPGAALLQSEGNVIPVFREWKV